MRTLVPALLVVLLTAGCSMSPAPAPAATQTVDAGQDMAALGDALDAVARDQTEADHAVNDALEAVRMVDERAARLSAPTTFDDALDGWSAVHDRVADTSVDGLRDGYLGLASRVDDARQTLADVRQEVAGERSAERVDDWEIEYLAAQDEVLVAVREYARVADQLAQLLIRHWPAYVEVDTRVTDFVPRRGNYRDTPEAVDALAVELDTALDDLAVAETQIAEYRERRTRAGTAVNDATADAVSVYDRRPDGASGA